MLTALHSLASSSHLDPVRASAGAGEVAKAHYPQTAGYASNESVYHYNLRRALGNHPVYVDNVAHGGLNQRFLGIWF